VKPKECNEDDKQKITLEGNAQRNIERAKMHQLQPINVIP